MVDYRTTERAVWAKFHVKRNDTRPYKGWAGTRETLAELIGELGFTEGAEIGVQRGLYSETLLKHNPSLHLNCIDPWHAYNRQTEEYGEENYKIAQARLAPYNVTYYRMRAFDAAPLIPDGSLDFVYIDGMHEFIPVMLDLILWTPKVKVGGIVAGHDYCDYYQGGVVDAVRAYTFANNIDKWYVTRDREPSWFWIAQEPLTPRYW